MKHLAATLPLYVLTLLTIYARASTNSQTDLKLVKITKTSIKPDEQTAQYEFTLQSDTDIQDIYCIILNVMQGTHETNYENSNVSRIEMSKNVTIPYQVAIDQFNKKVTLIMTVHNATQHTLAYMLQDWTPQEINPQLAWVGQSNNNADHKPSLRVKTDIDITIDNNQCSLTSSPCYFLHYQAGDYLEICLVATESTNELPGFYQCDKTLTATNSPDISSVSNIILTHKQEGKSLEIQAEYLPSSVVMDVLVYDEKDLTVNNIMYCNIKESTKCVVTLDKELPDKQVSILLVASDDSKVTESTELNFVDYKTETQLLTKSVVEIRWNSAENLLYTITLNEGITDVTTKVTLTCGENDNAKCKAYFLDLQATKSYVASVTYKPDKVSFTVASEIKAVEQDLPHMTIKTFTEKTTSEFIVTLSSSSSITSSRLYIAIINTEQISNPQETIYFIEDTGEISETAKDFTFDIEKSLLAHKVNLALVVTAHGPKDKDPALGVARVDPTFENIEPPAVNEVGTDSILWIRVRPTALSLTVNGKDCPKDISTYFEKDADFKEPLNLCRPAGKNLDEEEMIQCKLDGKIIPLTGPISMKLIELMYPESNSEPGDPSLKLSGEFTQSETKLEATYHNGIDYTVYPCDLITEEDLKDCTIDSVQLTGDKYNFLIVSLAEDKVSKSTVVEFEDYKTEAISVIEDIIQVNWEGEQYTTYDVYLEPKVDSSYSLVHVDCGDDQVDKCLAFFVDLVTKTEYTVKVKKQKNGDLNIVGNIITTPVFP
ncbi:uncharacterized protein [Palaemon carinicauda]